MNEMIKLVEERINVIPVKKNLSRIQIELFISTPTVLLTYLLLKLLLN